MASRCFKYCKTAAPAKPSSKKAARRSYVCLSATNPEAKVKAPKLKESESRDNDL